MAAQGVTPLHCKVRTSGTESMYRVVWISSFLNMLLSEDENLLPKNISCFLGSQLFMDGVSRRVGYQKVARGQNIFRETAAVVKSAKLCAKQDQIGKRKKCSQHLLSG